jgi:hypothetical protein
VVVEGVVGCVFVSRNRSAEKYSLRGKEVSNWLLEHGFREKAPESLNEEISCGFHLQKLYCFLDMYRPHQR